MRCVGSASVATGKVPGPHPNPTKVDQRRETLWWIDAHPDQSKGPEESDKDTSLRDAILSGAVSRAFLRPLEGKQKAAARLGHQNEPNYLKQYFNDSKEGRVPGVNVCDIRRCGLAMKKDKLFVRDSADGKYCL